MHTKRRASRKGTCTLGIGLVCVTSVFSCPCPHETFCPPVRRCACLGVPARIAHWHRGSEAALGAKGRRRWRRCELSLRVAKKCASCASVDASLSMGTGVRFARKASLHEPPAACSCVRGSAGERGAQWGDPHMFRRPRPIWYHRTRRSLRFRLVSSSSERPFSPHHLAHILRRTEDVR